MRVNGEDTVLDSTSRVLYEGELFTGEVVDTDEDGRTVSLTTYENGVEHGPQYEFFPDGSKKIEGNCYRGGVVGEWREWYANGRLAELNVFNQYGERIRRQRWDENGNLTEDKIRHPRRE